MQVEFHKDGFVYELKSRAVSLAAHGQSVVKFPSVVGLYIACMCMGMCVDV